MEFLEHLDVLIQSHRLEYLLGHDIGESLVVSLRVIALNAACKLHILEWPFLETEASFIRFVCSLDRVVCPFADLGEKIQSHLPVLLEFAEVIMHRLETDQLYVISIF